jgi:hypothetical protein
VEVLQVAYVDVTRPTDETGIAAPWPDPLPPLKGPIDLEGGRNHPFWIRVKADRGTSPGIHRGFIDLKARGYEARVPLEFEVFGFALPDRMSCTTAFGFSPANVWRYQKVKDPAQRRAVLEKYWADFSAHHISPYDPAPLDPLDVKWPSADWEGGRRDEKRKRSGRSALLVLDRSESAQSSARYRPLVPIPESGIVLAFDHRTAKDGHEFIVTLNHYDASGAWLSGRNNDMTVKGLGRWGRFEKEVLRFPEGAVAVRLTLWATRWKEDGSPTGAVWYDNVSLRDRKTGAPLIRGGGFEPLESGDFDPVFHWENWDRAMKRALEEHHFNSFRLSVPGLGGGSFHSRREPGLLGYGEDTPQYRRALAGWCRGVQDHLEKKGWLDEAFVYWFDEPAPRDYGFVMKGFRKLKEYAPRIHRMLTEQVEEELVGGPDIWCPVTPRYDPARARARRAEGDRFWWYVCTSPKAPHCTLFIDHPATEMRVWLWQTWKRGIEGILVWQTNYWTSSAAYPDPNRPQNPYEDPMGWVSGYSTRAGVKSPWGNGDGRFIYPPKAAAGARQEETVLDGPVSSIRWEMLRDGIEDYEYLAILKRLLASKRRDLDPVAAREIQELLTVPPAISIDLTHFTKDPAPIEKHRRRIARAIETLSAR